MNKSAERKSLQIQVLTFPTGDVMVVLVPSDKTLYVRHTCFWKYPDGNEVDPLDKTPEERGLSLQGVPVEPLEV